MWTLNQRDFKIAPILETAWNGYLSNGYKAKVDNLMIKRWTEEKVRGYSPNQINEVYHYLAFVLGALIYEEIHRGVNISYEYYDEKYDFPTIRETLSYYHIDLDQIFAAYGLFNGEVIYPVATVTPIIDLQIINYPFVVETITRNLVKGYNTITHGFEKEVVGLVVMHNNMSEYLKWSTTHVNVTDNKNQVVIYSPQDWANVDIILNLK